MIYRLKQQHGDTIAVPQLVFAKLGTAEELSVRVALYILATGVTDPTVLAADLKLRSRVSAENALVYWAGAGLLEQLDEAAPTDVPAAPPAPMTWQQIADASRTDPMIAGLIECAQQSFGRSLSHSEMQKLVGFYLQEGVAPEVLMLCLSYLATGPRRTMGALSHELKAWQAEGVVTGEDADAWLQKLDARAKHEATVCGLLGISADDLTLGARKAIARWYESYGYGEDMLREALLHAGANRDVWYLNGILKSWNAKKLRTVYEVRGSGTTASTDSRNIRVDRETPSGSDFLQTPADRPRRLKRKD